jgi:hypothetical protein
MNTLYLIGVGDFHNRNYWSGDIIKENDLSWAYEIGSNMPKGAKMMRDDIGSLWRVNWYEIAENFLSDVAVS